jgi:hypothetical protein
MSTNYLQDYWVYWREVLCPECTKSNWIYDSHSQRAYPDIPNACECHNCGHKFFLGDQNEFEARFLSEIEEYGIERTLAEYVSYEKGLPSPR